MLPKQNRLSQDWAIKKVRRRGRRLKTRYFNVIVNRRQRGQFSRFAIVVSTKVSKKAVTRNLLKRRVRTIISRNLDDIKPLLDIVITFFPGADKQTVTNLEKDLQRALKQGNYLLKSE